MKIESVKGIEVYDDRYPKRLRDSVYITSISKLVRDDFVLARNEIIRGSFYFNSNTIWSKFTLKLKPEILDQLREVLPFGDINDGIYYTSVSEDVKFNGCRTEEAKEIKFIKILAEKTKKWEDNVEQRWEDEIRKANKDLQEKVEHTNYLYKTSHIKFLGGELIDPDWVKSDLPTLAEDESIAELEKEIKSINNKIKGVKAERKIKRNKLMLEMMVKDDWDVGGNKVVDSVIEELTEMYNKCEAFSKETSIIYFRKG